MLNMPKSASEGRKTEGKRERKGVECVVGISSYFRHCPGQLTPTQPGHPCVGQCNEYWRLATVLATAREETASSVYSSGSCYQDC